MKGTEENIVDFLKANPGKFASAHLERMYFKNKRGNNASPKSIRNRLQDAAREPNAVLLVTYDEKGYAYYQIKEEHRKRVYSYVPIIKDGKQVGVREVQTIV